MLWTITATNESLVHQLSDSLEVPEVLGRLLVHAGIEDAVSADAFLRPRLANLDDPFALTNLRAAVTRIEQAVEAKESVVVFGDYDVDGVTSTVQLVSLLRKLELDPRYCVPLRLEEGYGLSKQAIDRVFAGNIPKLFIALDCGTNAHEAIHYLREQGVDVIIVDHHQSKTQPPNDCIFINPHVNDSASAPWRELCTAGLVFKLLHGILKSRRAANDPRVDNIQLKDYLDLVAMGTIADLVPLHKENRILSWFGLHHLRGNIRKGVRALAEVSGISTGQEMVSSDISFKMAPRINASGRLADASLPIELLLDEDYQACRTRAEQLDTINRERQAIERRIAQEAEERVMREFNDEPGVVLYGADWHPGVVGIVASRVSRRFNKPCVILGAEGELAKGSGRSVEGVNLVEVFKDCSDLLGHWGGHPMAAGVSLKVVDVEVFTQRFVESIHAVHPNGLPEPSLRLSAWLKLEQVSESLLEQLDRLHPYGQGNSEPVFGVRGVVLEEPPKLFGENNYRLRLPDPTGQSRGMAGVAWRLSSAPTILQPIDIAIRVSWNFWRNQRTAQFTLVDWKNSEVNA